MAELATETDDQIEELSEQGSFLFDRGDYRGAIGQWQQALAALPPPANDWEAAMWLHSSIGDAYYQSERYAQARAALSEGLGAPGALENPFVWYRLGQSEHKSGDMPAALEHLLRAYMLDGRTIFDADEEGQQYLELLQDAGLI